MTLIQAFVPTLMLVLMIDTLTGLRSPERRNDYRAVLLDVKWWMIPGALIIITIVALTHALLYAAIPLTRWGWWSAIGGQGNAVLGQVIESHSPYLRIVGITLPIMLLVGIPLLALIEERAFRKGTHNLSAGRTAARSLKFGLAHLITGIPLSAALAISVAGAIYHGIYVDAHRRLPESTPDKDDKATVTAAAQHALTNTMLVAMAGAYIVALLAKNT